MATALTGHNTLANGGVETKKLSHRKVRDAIASQQVEIWDLAALNTKLLHAIAKLICGQVHEQRQAIDVMLDMISTDVRIAERMLRIMEANPHMKAESPELFEHAMRAAWKDRL